MGTADYLRELRNPRSELIKNLNVENEMIQHNVKLTTMNGGSLQHPTQFFQHGPQNRLHVRCWEGPGMPLDLDFARGWCRVLGLLRSLAILARPRASEFELPHRVGGASGCELEAFALFDSYVRRLDNMRQRAGRDWVLACLGEPDGVDAGRQNVVEFWHEFQGFDGRHSGAFFMHSRDVHVARGGVADAALAERPFLVVLEKDVLCLYPL